MDPLLYFRVNKAVGNHFLIAFVVEQRFHALKRQIRFAVAAHDQARLHRFVRNIVIAIDAGNLFDQVFFDLHVETPARRHGMPLILAFGNFTAQTTQNVANLLIFNVMANQTIQFAAAQTDGRRLRQSRFIGHVNNRTRFTAANIHQQAGCALHCLILQRGVHAALVAVGSIGMQTMTAGAAGNGQRAEERAFQQNVLRFIVYAGVLAAENSAHSQGFLVVSNNQSIGIQISLGAVEQDQGFAFMRHTHDNSAFNAVFIEGVHRLAELEQNVVGHVNNGIDGANAAAAQLLFHP